MAIRNHYLIFDVETQILPLPEGGGSGPGINNKRKTHASPYYGAQCVIAGFKAKGDGEVSTIRTMGNSEGYDCLLSHIVRGSSCLVPVLVGHNVGFDLHHILYGVDLDDVPDFTIWDTQTAEYYLEAQTLETRFNRLDDLAVKYGGTLKDSKISDYFKAGIGADKIPEDELVPYLEADVLNTEKVFLAQYGRAAELGMLPFLRQMFDAQMCTWDMERNGIGVEPSTVDQIEHAYTARRQELDKDLAESWTKYFPLMDEKDRNPDSNPQLLAVCTSGEYKYREREKVGVFKNGKDKMKFVQKTAMVDGLGLNIKEVGEKTLSTIDHPLIRDILELRKLRKTLDTYCKGYLRSTDSSGTLRTDYNHSVTPTGRVSSSNPNLQNLPKE